MQSKAGMGEVRCAERVESDTYQTDPDTYQSGTYRLGLSPNLEADIRSVMHLNRLIVKTLFLYFLLFPAVNFSQIIGTHLALGGTGTDQGLSIAVDGSGNMYIGGFFSGTMDADPSGTTVNLVGSGGGDAYLAKYSSGGTLLWARSFGGTGFDEIRALDLDASGNVYVAGRFNSTVDFDPSGGTFSLTSAGGSDGFVSQFKSDGSFVNAIQIGGTGQEIIYDIAVFASDHFYITGSFQGTADFDPLGTTLNLTSSGSDDLFLAQYSMAGSVQFANAIGGSSFDTGFGLALDVASNIFLTGSFAGTVDIDPGASTTNLTSTGFTDIFLARYNKVGEFQWGFNLGGTGFFGNSARKVAVDATSIYLVGQFTGTADFDPSGGTANLNGGTVSGFLASYDMSGAYQWALALNGGFGAISSTDAVTVDNAGYVYIAGSMSNTVDFDPSAGTTNITSAGGSDAFMARYDVNGNLSWAFGAGGTSTDGGNALAATSTRVMGIGSYQGTADFDPSTGNTANTSNGQTDIWTTMYSTTVFPVEWAYVEAEAADEGVWINWGTASEQNTERFVIERSVDKHLFEAIGETPAKGNSQTLETYAHLDQTPLTGTSYYRLRQIDLNGHFAYSHILTVEIGQADLSLELYPNPAQDKISYQLHGDLSITDARELRLLTAQGICVHHVIKGSASNGELDIRFLPPGLYFLQVRAGQEVRFHSFVKNRD
ncbi:MAG: T9SS type A sorting domain-containing protein [Bacteroidota bacterium]